MTTVLATAADARYGRWLLNLIGSVQRKSDIFDRMVVYDLGLTPFQRWLLNGARGVEVRTVPPFVPHWKQGRTWKTWIWTHVEGDAVVWLDAGITVLRPLTDFVEGAERRGYFVVSQGTPVGKTIPSDYYELYGLRHDVDTHPSIAAGILAFRRGSSFYSDVIEPTFDDAVLGRSLGFSPGDATRFDWGLDKLDQPIVRDCSFFRWDQTLLGIHFYRSVSDPHIDDLLKYGGWKSPRQHAEQVIWSHRRSGDYRFLPRLRYRPMTALVGVPWGSSVYASWTVRRYGWLFQPDVQARLARRLLTTGRLRNTRA